MGQRMKQTPLWYNHLALSDERPWLMLVQEAEAIEAKYSKGLSEQVGRLQVHNKSDGRSDMSEVRFHWHIALRGTSLTTFPRGPTRKVENSRSFSAATQDEVWTSPRAERRYSSLTETGRLQDVQEKLGSCIILRLSRGMPTFNGRFPIIRPFNGTRCMTGVGRGSRK